MSEVNETEEMKNAETGNSVEIMSGVVEPTETGETGLEEKKDKNKLELKSSISLGTISTNLDEIKANVEGKIAEYTSMAITDETYIDAKKYITLMSSIETQITHFKTGLRKTALSFISPQEKKCIENNELIENGKNKIKAVTDTYDEKVREANKEKAQTYIDEAIVRFALKPEYAERMQLKDEYYKTLHVVIKQIKGDVEKQAMDLRDEQTKRENLEIVLKTTVDTANINIIQKMNVGMFSADVKKAMSDKNLDGEWLSGRITAKAAEIKEAEDIIAKNAAAEALAKKALEDEEMARLQREKEEREAQEKKEKEEREKAAEAERQAAEAALANEAKAFEIPEPIVKVETDEERAIREAEECFANTPSVVQPSAGFGGESLNTEENPNFDPYFLKTTTDGSLLPASNSEDNAVNDANGNENEVVDQDDFRKSIMASRHIKPVVPNRDDRQYVMTIEVSGNRADLKLVGDTIKDSCNKNSCTYKVREDLFHQI